MNTPHAHKQRTPHDIGNLLVGEILKGVEYQRCALFFLEVSDGGAELVELLPMDDFLLGIAVGRHLFAGILQLVATDKALALI